LSGQAQGSDFHNPTVFARSRTGRAVISDLAD
jgi:hypothetical protein